MEGLVNNSEFPLPQTLTQNEIPYLHFMLLTFVLLNLGNLCRISWSYWFWFFFDNWILYWWFIWRFCETMLIYWNLMFISINSRINSFEAFLETFFIWRFVWFGCQTSNIIIFLLIKCLFCLLLVKLLLKLTQLFLFCL